jgi:hypothetical protein
MNRESGWFEIFKTGGWNGGTYFDADGKMLEEPVPFSKAHLDRIVKNFESDPIDPRPKLKLEHDSMIRLAPKPMHGYVSALERRGNRLMAKATDVSPELTDLVNSGKFPDRSVELWNGFNSKEGLVLGAVAFIGADLPGVSGMADFKFTAENQDGARPRCFRFAAENLEEFQFEEKGGDEMDKKEIEEMVANAAAKAVEAFQSGEGQKALNAKAKLADELQEKTKELESLLQETQIKSVFAKCETFVNGLLKEKKISPAIANGGLAAFMASLDGKEKLAFAKGGDKVTQREYFESVIGELCKLGGIFKEIDGDPERKGEVSDVSDSIAKFAEKNELDPKLVALAYKGFSARGSVDEDGDVAPLSMSIGTTVKAKQ